MYVPGRGTAAKLNIYIKQTKIVSRKLYTNYKATGTTVPRGPRSHKKVNKVSLVPCVFRAHPCPGAMDNRCGIIVSDTTASLEPHWLSELVALPTTLVVSVMSLAVVYTEE